MLGKKHTEATKAKMRKAALGSKKSFYFRSVEDCEGRKKFRRMNNGYTRKDITIEDVMYYRNKGLSQRRIADILECSQTVVENRINGLKKVKNRI